MNGDFYVFALVWFAIVFITSLVVYRIVVVVRALRNHNVRKSVQANVLNGLKRINHD